MPPAPWIDSPSSFPLPSVLLAVSLGGLLFAAACGRPVLEPAAEPSPDRSGGAGGGRGRFAAFASSFTLDALALSPPSATLVGLRRHRDEARGETLEIDHLLDDCSPEATARKIRFYRSALETLDRGFPAAGLSEAERIDRALIENQCRLALLDLERLRTIETNPTVAVESIGTALFFPVVLEYAPVEERGEAVVSRLEGLPAFVDQAIAALRTSAPIFTQVAIEENQGNADVIRGILPALFPQGSDLLPRFAAARDRALEAVARLDAFLSKDMRARSNGDWRLGPELYAERFRAYFQEDLDPRDVLKEAEESVASVRAEMRDLAAPLHDEWYPRHEGHRTMKDPKARAGTIVREVLDRIGREHPARDALFESVRHDLGEIGAFLDAHPIVSVVRRDTLQISETPPFLRGIYGVAGLFPPPALRPDLAAFYYVTPIPKEWPAEKAESRLREYNRYKLILLSIHEALPGHYTQSLYANEVQPEWRRALRSVYGNNGYVEGWAQYAEEAMLEAGVHDPRDPKMKLTFLKEELRIMANAIMDIRLHTLGMTDSEAVDLMTKETFQERAEADGKLRRAKLSSAQLATYYVGWRGWRALRREVESARGAAFDLRTFHDEALGYGAVPLGDLRRLMAGTDPQAPASPGAARPGRTPTASSPSRRRSRR
jgi:uncharacterized protein (DUF885 family)